MSEFRSMQISDSHMFLFMESPTKTTFFPLSLAKNSVAFKLENGLSKDIVEKKNEHLDTKQQIVY